MKTLYPFYKMTTKDIAIRAMCSIRSAERLKSEIKREFNIKVVRYKHFLKYFGNE